MVINSFSIIKDDKEKDKEERKEKDIPSHQRMLAISFLFSLKILTYRSVSIQVYIMFPAHVEEKQRERRERKRGRRTRGRKQTEMGRR